MNKEDLKKLVDIRLAEANTLLQAENYHGAYYLAGYVLECAVKVCITNQVSAFDFPNKQLAMKSHTHNLSELITVAGLKQKLKEQEEADVEFSLNWAVAKDWSETSRYECNVEKSKAIDFLDAVNDGESGILKWLKNFW
ncbi:TPA: hypothetical protein ACPVYA_004268 [Vibrio parahaemolyticus]|uniref:hypothetical protein n=1 Tax=Vibrio parahaemolyticus TaxID=670 RepID=UPI0004A25679|nr:hypothetical protein [Vibrio parahaemolyticus]MBE4138070.1 DNA-binding protein [Vibrio parahaemolyticus]MQF42728.1 DNA-binding protein [Vibrio parahaemolyticus]TOZ80092.1 DNA-binding protein [Vibrio parahaemolyticus]TOZ99812.1 DNA-binding protein [Vibrio parahaemolyticus]HCE1985903.1 hypothetical protein [Vibrio parahaemolyticus]